MNIEEQITLYPELTGEERATVEAYVAAHPEWQPALDEAKRWDRLLKDVRLLGQEPSGDEALAYYVVSRRLQPERAPEAIAHLIRSIEERIERDPGLAIRVAEMESRLRAAEEGSPASEQFERLMRRRRSHDGREERADSGRPKPAKTMATDRPGQGSQDGAYAARRASEGDGWDGADQTGHAVAGSRPRRLAVGALISLMALYGVLYVAGDLARPSHERLADFSDQELMLEGYESVRGDAPGDEPSPPIGTYLDALTQLRRAQTSAIGLFPGFDEDRLDSAVVLLQEVIRSEPAESFLASEATFLLGKAELARGNVDAARQAFSQVTAIGGRRSSDARRILAEL